MCEAAFYLFNTKTSCWVTDWLNESLTSFCWTEQTTCFVFIWRTNSVSARTVSHLCHKAKNDFQLQFQVRSHQHDVWECDRLSSFSLTRSWLAAFWAGVFHFIISPDEPAAWQSVSESWFFVRRLPVITTPKQKPLTSFHYVCFVQTTKKNVFF